MRLDLLEDDDLPVDFGRYRVVRVLGEGGMARVFEAELGGAEGFRKRVALKVVRGSETRRDPALRRALVREARLGGLLRHPGIVDTYDFGEHDGQVYIAMELVRGAGLDQLLRERGGIPPEVVVELAIQITDALDHAHTATDDGRPLQLVHRDLKPSNILVSNEGTVKVADFGIAKAATIAGDTRTGETKGTPLYMSPEQLEGADLDGRSDLFALGAMLWEMALGERLQRAESLPALVLATLRVDERLDEPGALSPLEQVVPGLGAVVAGCLRRNVDERYADAAALLVDLKAIRARLPTADLRAWMGAAAASPMQSAPTPRMPPRPMLDTIDTPPPPESRVERPVVLSSEGGRASDVPPTRAQKSAPSTRGRSTARRSPLLPALGFAVVALLCLVGALVWRGASVEVTEVPPDQARPGLRMEVGPVDPSEEEDDGVVAADPEPVPEQEWAASSPDRPSANPAPERRARPPVRKAPSEPRSEPASRGLDPRPVEPAPIERSPEPMAVAEEPAPREAVPPAATPTPLAVTFADYDRIRGRGQKIRLRFTVETRCPEGCTVVLQTADARGDRKRPPMEPSGNRWTGEVVYPSSSAGHIKWWVTATDPDGNVARYGTEARPEDAVVR